MAQKTAKKAAPKAQRQTKDSGDIIEMILADHKPLKALIKILKNSDDHELEERQAAFEEFCPLLVAHAKPEEQTLYVVMKDDDDMREGGYEGDVEHQLADQVIEEVKRASEDDDLWSARVKVLAELVEHHIEEEEEEMLPDFRKNTEKEQRLQLGQQYTELKIELGAQLEEQGGEDAPSEQVMSQKKPKNENRVSAR